MAALRTLAFLAFAGVSSSQTSDCSYNSLLTHLTTSNEALDIMRPVKNWTTPTVVQLEMLLYGILDVDEKFQTVSLHISIHMYWTNEFLAWNSSEFCGIDLLTVKRSMLWTPDIAIQEDSSDIGTTQKNPFAVLYPSGLVHVNARQRLTYTCQLNLFLFPFDVQRCNITFTSMSSDEESIKLTGTTFKRLPDEFLQFEGEWKLKSLETIERNFTKNNSSTTKLIYSVVFQRKPFLYIINLIVPLLFLLVLDLASFFISEAGGEKLNFKVTVLLSIFLLLLILQDILPSTEENLPMIAIYCVSVFTMVWISVLETMLVGFLMDSDVCCDKKVQNPVVDIQLEANGDKISLTEPAEGDQFKPDDSNLPPDQPGDLMRQILNKVKAARQKLRRSQNGDERSPGCYGRRAEIFDSVFYVIYLTAVVSFQVFSFAVWLPNVFS
ncbi:5-hydroxytryptamine receptor 3A-like [Leuresthes tenuis]|uniref:5-hydroxytryptamine receptor 3A-like n=1 Tax=Leuresthes tenuis TaxID=355514 RepID=UPI003B5008BE